MSTATPAPAYRRHDISDRAWETIAPHLSRGPGKVGRSAEGNHCFINAVFWILRTGAPSSALSSDYGTGTPPHTLFRVLADNGQWAQLLAAVSDDPDLSG